MTPLPVLYVEDEPNDALLVSLGFKRANVRAPLTTVPDGRDAIEYLSGTGAYADRQRHPLPCLVLLDLKLPVVDGFETLQWIRSQPQLKEMAVVVFSSSKHPKDIKRAQELGADDYICKPNDMTDLRCTILALEHRWLLSQPAGGDLQGSHEG